MSDIIDIAIDTETVGYRPIPFIATSCDQELKTRLYDIKNRSNFYKLRSICESGQYRKVFHNAVFDISALRHVGINVAKPYDDTMIMASLINENFSSRKLKELAFVYLNEDCRENEELQKLKAKYKKEIKKGCKDEEFDYSMIPPKILYPYAIKDAIYTIKLFYYFMEPLKKFEKLYNIELDLIPIIIDMQERGIRVNRKFIKEWMSKCEINIKDLKELLKSDVIKSGIYNTLNNEYKNKQLEKRKPNSRARIKELDFKLTSGKQIGRVLELMGIEVEHTEKGSIQTDKKSLSKIKDNKFIDDLLLLRFYNKQYGTYYEPLYNYYTSDKDDSAHFGLYASGAKTGRFSAELIQTIPRPDDVVFGIENEEKYTREVRKSFIPRSGYYFVCIDYCQQEMRVFAHVAKAILMIKDFKNGIDPYVGTGINIFGKEKVMSTLKAIRKMMKDICLGVNYGMGVAKLAASLGVPLKEAYEILDAYYTKYPVKEAIAELTAELYKEGCIKIEFHSELMDLSREYKVPIDKAYKALNCKIQGISAYVMKLAMIRINKFIKVNKLDMYNLLTVHDELIFEVSKKYKPDYIIPKLVDLMEDRVTFDVPITADAKYSYKSWGECEKWIKKT